LVRLSPRTPPPPDSSAGIVSVVVVRDRLGSEPTVTVVVDVVVPVGDPPDATDAVNVVDTIVMDIVGSTAALPVIIFDITDGESCASACRKPMEGTLLELAQELLLLLLTVPCADLSVELLAKKD